MNKSIGHANKIIQSKELEIINVTTMYDKETDKDKEYLIMNDIKEKKKTLSASEKIEKSHDGYV